MPSLPSQSDLKAALKRLTDAAKKRRSIRGVLENIKAEEGLDNEIVEAESQFDMSSGTE